MVVVVVVVDRGVGVACAGWGDIASSSCCRYICKLVKYIQKKMKKKHPWARDATRLEPTLLLLLLLVYCSPLLSLPSVLIVMVMVRVMVEVRGYEFGHSVTR